MEFRYYIVEDALFLQEIYKEHLDALGGHCVGMETSGDRALFEIQRTLPDLVILDIVVPRLNGIDLSKKLKSLHPLAYIIAISSIDDLHFIEKAKEAGIHSYLIKPFSKKQIIELVNQFKMNNLRGNLSHG